MTMGRMNGFNNWCIIHLDQNQAGWSPFQPSQELCNISIPIGNNELNNTSGIQITASNNGSKIEPSGYVKYYSLNKHKNKYDFDFSINYYTDSFKFYIGYKTDLYFNACFINYIKYGKHV